MGLLKKVAGLVGSTRAWPHVWRYRLARAVMGEVRAFPAASERVGSIPGYVGLYTRDAFYARLLAHVGSDTYLGFQSVFSKTQARIGDRVYIGRFCSIGWADIGDDVMLADGVQILSGRHQHGRGTAEGATLRENKLSFTQVKIGRGAWLGAGAIVMADVGEDAIVAAGAVVVHPVPRGERVAGVPARPIRSAATAATATTTTEREILPTGE